MESLREKIDLTQKKELRDSQKKIEKELNDIRWALDESTIVAITNARGTITYVNDQFMKISKYEKEELIGQNHSLLNSGYHSKSFFKDMWRTIGTGNVWRGEIKNRAKDGSEYWVKTTIVPFLNEEGKPYQYIAIRTDITDRVHTEKALQEALENDFRQMIKKLANLIFTVNIDEDNHFILTLSEGRIAEKLGITTNDLQNKRIKDFFPPTVSKFMEPHFQEAYSGEYVSFEGELWGIDFLIHLSPIIKNGEVYELVGTAIDMTEHKKAENKIKYMAYHDIVTGLPNRVQLTEELEERIKGTEDSVTIMFLDLDRFKNINDALGHTSGDELLKAVGNRLVESVGPEDMVARFGGDEYVILFSGLEEEEVISRAEHILAEIDERFLIKNIDIYISTSIGISVFPQDGKTSEELIKNADIAMYQAKENGKNNFQFFNSDFVMQLNNKVILESALHVALEENQFHLYYQPQIDLEQNKLIGVEALIRWEHPELGMVSPAEFIPLAEETGLIIPIGEWVLRTASEQNKEWQRKGYAPIVMSVNISMRQFISRGFPELVRQVLEETKLDPAYLDLEITESVTSNIEFTEQILQQLQDIGVIISVDDFGTGYSSLNYLSELPINKLKIDQSFLRMDDKNKSIIKTVIALADNLNMEVIAEGVETEEHVAFLMKNQCNLAQGYLFSKPLKVQDMEMYLKEN